MAEVSAELWDELKDLGARPDLGVFCMVCLKEIDKPGHEIVTKHIATGEETRERGEDCLIVMFDGRRMGVVHSRPECQQSVQGHWPEATTEWLRGE